MASVPTASSSFGLSWEKLGHIYNIRSDQLNGMQRISARTHMGWCSMAPVTSVYLQNYPLNDPVSCFTEFLFYQLLIFL